MPLIKGKSASAFKTNMEEMMNSGRPQNQALAAAYATKRMSQRRKMAKGGEVDNEDLDPENEAMGPAESILDEMRLNPKDDDDMPMMSSSGMVKAIRAKKLAQGGQLPESLDYLDEDESYPDPDLREFDMLDPHQPDFMAEGGMVEHDEKEERRKRVKKIFDSMGA